MFGHLIVLLVAVANCQDCLDEYQCGSCSNTSGCAWCMNAQAPICMEVGLGFACGYLSGTFLTPEECNPPPPVACNDYGVSCDNCTVGSLESGLSCVWCAADGAVTGEACIPSGGSACDLVSGVEYSSCPSECPGPVIVGDTVHVHPEGDDAFSCCCGDTPGNACATIRCAVSRARQAERAMVVLLADGVYYEHSTTISYNGHGLTLRAATTHAAVIDAGGGGRVLLFLEGHTSSTVVEGVVLSGGLGRGGGGLRVQSASPTFVDVIVRNCTSTQSIGGPSIAPAEAYYGGGVYLDSSTSTFTRCEFSDNFVVSTDGDCLGVGVYAATSALIIEDCVFAGNTASTFPRPAYGAALAFDGAMGTSGVEASNMVKRCVFDHNAVVGGESMGGAVIVYQLANVQFEDCVFEGNTAIGGSGAGGGLMVQAGATEVTRCVFTNNRAEGDQIARGGAASFNYWAGFGIVDSIFEGNTAVATGTFPSSCRGGAIEGHSYSEYIRTFRNVTFARNTASASYYAEGGAMSWGGTSIGMSGCSFEQNLVYCRDGGARGGGIAHSNPPVPDISFIQDSIFRGNSVASTQVAYTGTDHSGGSAVSLSTGAQGTISRCTFEYNNVEDGFCFQIVGGTVLYHGSSTGYTIIEDCFFDQNYAFSGKSVMGAAICVKEQYNLDIRRTIVTGNTVRSSTGYFYSMGGGVAATGASIRISDSLIAGNTVIGFLVTGGGLAVATLTGTYHAVFVHNTTIEYNIVSTGGEDATGCMGGGIFMLSADGTIQHSVLRGNSVTSRTGFDGCSGAGFAVVKSRLLELRYTRVLNNYGTGAAFRGGGFAAAGAEVDMHQSRVCGNALPEVACDLSCGITGNSGFLGDATSSLVLNVCPAKGAECDSFCNSHGSCSHDVCSCDDGYYGPECNQTCNGGVPMCSGHGTCSNAANATSGNCTCEAGFYEPGCVKACLDNCSYGLTGALCDDGEDGSGLCLCPPTFHSPNCSQECPGKIVQPNGLVLPCFGVGSCDDGALGSGTCTCEGNFAEPECFDCLPGWSGYGCSVPCPGMARNCSGHGTCDAGRSGEGKCSCVSGYFGLDCAGECPGGADDQCFGHGICDDGVAGTGLCTCASPGWAASPGCEHCTGYYGAACDQPCPVRDDGVCGGPDRGLCVDGMEGNGTCLCMPGVVGEMCEVVCPGFVPGGSSTDVCSGHGSCQRDGSCSCASGFSGAGCQITTELLGVTVNGENEGKSNVGVVVSLGILLPLLILSMAAAAFYVWYNQLFCFASYVDADSSTVQHSDGSAGQMRKYVLGLLDQRNSRHIGTGGAADVYKVKVDSKWIAIKKLKSASALGLAEFHQEIAVLSTFAASDGHPNVISLLFFCDDPPCIAMELCEGGSLASQLHGTASMDDGTKIGYAIQCATGMEFLHENKIGHLDLKPDNCLLTKDKILKISDFGIANTTGELNGNDFTGTVQYMAPERFKGGTVDPFAADVFSFGILMWALWSREKPYGDDSHATLAAALTGGSTVPRPPALTTCSAMYSALMERCWDDDPLLRPTFSEALAALSSTDNTLALDSFLGSMQSDLQSQASHTSVSSEAHHSGKTPMWAQGDAPAAASLQDE